MTRDERRLLQEEKKKFRGRKAWKDWCDFVKSARGYRCEVCGKELTKVIGNVHHRINADTIEEYSELRPDRFLLLCVACHDWVHLVHNSPRFKKWKLAHAPKDEQLPGIQHMLCSE